MEPHVLSNPVWSSLTTDHASLAIGGNLAKRYPADVLPFCAVPASGEVFTELDALVKSGERVVVPGGRQPELAGWQVVHQFEVYQFVLETPVSVAEPVLTSRLLGVEDVPDMLELTQLVYPAYFRAKTAALGDYLGIRYSGQLVAMAGIRFSFPGYQEISAVCVHPDFRGRGLAKQLVAEVAGLIQSRGRVPFLHTETDNPAQKIYAQVGFQIRETRPVRVYEKG